MAYVFFLLRGRTTSTQTIGVVFQPDENHK
jgi:hypothetical protein